MQTKDKWYPVKGKSEIKSRFEGREMYKPKNIIFVTNSLVLRIE